MFLLRTTLTLHLDTGRIRNLFRIFYETGLCIT